MPTPQKEARVASLKESLTQGKAIYLTDFAGISAAGMSDLRGKVLEVGGHIEVVKNRLLKLALAGTPAEVISEYLKGPTAVVFCLDDPISPAKIMKDFSKGLTGANQRWAIKAAFVDGRLFGTDSAPALADLPPVDQIKGAVVGALAGPMSSLFFTLNAALADLVYTLQAVADKREQQAA